MHACMHAWGWVQHVEEEEMKFTRFYKHVVGAVNPASKNADSFSQLMQRVQNKSNNALNWACVFTLMGGSSATELKRFNGFTTFNSGLRIGQ